MLPVSSEVPTAPTPRRRAYIVQFAPDGADTLIGDPDAGPPTARAPQDDPTRQFPVLVAGARP